ncbi:CDP-alcohol phosphatidyltransferase family protein [Pilimelia columellifera]|uniref:CDP-alcohol phosphatidyltransferase family protein n=1 Tax=Pilimelia columellifera subsp. columellifera TaxID=706583 RepID=A0ABP6A7C4_9ACTN
MSNRVSIDEIRSRTYKARDAWWTVILVDPVASRLVQWAAPYRWITPNLLTGVALLLGLASAACFATAESAWLIVGGLLFHLSFVVDCMDGKVARLNGTGSFFGVWLDFIVDEIRIIIAAAALMGGQFAATGNPLYLWAAFGILAVHLIRYMSAWHMGKVRAAMRRRRREIAELGADYDARSQAEQAEVDAEDDDDSAETPRDSLSLVSRVRTALLRRRIRTHLVSGIEFQMAAFIIGPITGAVIAAPVIAGAAMLAFEVLLAARLLRQVDRFEATNPTPAEITATIPRPRSATARVPADA